MSKGTYATVVTCLLLLTVVACGEGETEEAKAADAYNAVVDAMKAKDYETACARLTETTRRDLRKAATVEGTDGCGSTLKRVVETVGVRREALTEVDSSQVELDGQTRATVGNVRMSREGDEWRLEGDLDYVRPFLSGGVPAR